MKRRLTRAYDHMTMPDRCAHRIEQRLSEQLQQQKTGRYTKAVSPAPAHRRSWAAAIAAVCLVLVLSVGGTILFLYASETMMVRPVETTVSTAPVESQENPREVTDVQFDQRDANAAFLEVLEEKQGFSIPEVEGTVTIAGYCENRSKALGTPVSVSCFTMLDMDRDGLKELVLWISIEGDSLEDYLILDYQELDGGTVFACLEAQQKITDLKKDGSFYLRGIDGGWASSILDLSRSTGREKSLQVDIPAADWHRYPCRRADLVLQSYEAVTDVGQSRWPSGGYYTFENLILKRTANDWDSIREYGLQTYVVEEDSVTMFDPDAPGTVLYGTLTDEKGFRQFSEVGFYCCTQEREYQAEACGLLTEDPQYAVDVMDPEREAAVRDPMLLLAYFGWTEVPDEKILQEQEAVKDLTDAFIQAYFADDVQAMEACLAEDYQGRKKYDAPEAVQILSYGYLPERVAEVGDTLYLGIDLHVPGQEKRLWTGLDLVKQADGWKVLSYRHPQQTE